MISLSLVVPQMLRNKKNPLGLWRIGVRKRFHCMGGVPLFIKFGTEHADGQREQMNGKEKEQDTIFCIPSQ